MSTQLESIKNEDKVCPLLSIGSETLCRCLGEECAFYVRGLGICGIALLCTTLPLLVARKENEKEDRLVQERDDLGV